MEGLVCRNKQWLNIYTKKLSLFHLGELISCKQNTPFQTRERAPHFAVSDETQKLVVLKIHGLKKCLKVFNQDAGSQCKPVLKNC
jgi:hypothetical protein